MPQVIAKIEKGEAAEAFRTDLAGSDIGYAKAFRRIGAAAAQQGAPTIDPDRLDAIKKELFRPLEVYEESRTGVTRGEVNPAALSPKTAGVSAEIRHYFTPPVVTGGPVPRVKV